MAILVWVTMGVALWHGTVFLPDRFKGGIVGVFIGSVVGACVTGAIFQAITGDSIGQTSILTALAAVPGVALGVYVTYRLGVRSEESARAATP